MSVGSNCDLNSIFLPLCIKSYCAVVGRCQIVYTFFIRIACTFSIRLGIPTIEAVVCSIKGVRCQVLSSTIGEVLNAHCTSTAISVERNGVSVRCPLGVESGVGF